MWRSKTVAGDVAQRGTCGRHTVERDCKAANHQPGNYIVGRLFGLKSADNDKWTDDRVENGDDKQKRGRNLQAVVIGRMNIVDASLDLLDLIGG